MKAWGRMGMKIYTHKLGHMTNMAAMPIYGKNLKKSSPEPIDQWPWNFVCSIVYGSTTKIVQVMTLVWPWPILRQGLIWSHRLLYGKQWKLFIFIRPVFFFFVKRLYYVIPLGVRPSIRPSVCKLFRFRVTPPTVYVQLSWDLVYSKAMRWFNAYYLEVMVQRFVAELQPFN